MILLILLCLPTAWNYERREINNPILPISLGQTFITHSQHVALYHINISHINISVQNTQKLLEQTQQILTKNILNDEFSYMTFHKFNQTKDFLKVIQNNILTFQKSKRDKRGLINVVGKVNKWLFGTLDSDDERKYDQYFSALADNQQILQNEFSKEHTVLTDVIGTYTNHINKVEHNQKILISKIEALEIKEISAADALYISLILDNVMFQLNTIKHLLDRIDIAISFAKLGIMHNSILNTYQLSEMTTNIQKRFGDNVITFEEPIHYYSLFTTQVFVKENIVVFSIHIPIIYPQQFILYKIFPIPIQNQTILIPKPFILLTEKTYWTTPKECPKIEDLYICNQDELSKKESCLHELLTTNTNRCPKLDIHFENSLTQRISGNEILVIPARPVPLKSNCPTSIRNDNVRTPSVITIQDCPLEIDGKIYIQEDKSKFEYILDMPEIHFQPYEEHQIPIKINEVNTQELLDAQKILETIKFQNLSKPGMATIHWTISLATLSTIIIVASIAIIGIWKFKKPKAGKAHIEIALEDRKTREPMFSELEEGGVM